MQDRITVDPSVHFGKPCICGTRIPVRDVLELVREGLSFSEIIDDYYPNLMTDDIRACVQFALALVESEEIHVAHGTT
ncbi:MAG: DUF433 domain-containing protein [Planctomycetota bacterium]|nr:DUF433 domain-containing protein [Planctomycetota bacterium]MDA1137887.1 DUF433 domain-containing protein [Planctomycetota bacterium]